MCKPLILQSLLSLTLLISQRRALLFQSLIFLFECALCITPVFFLSNECLVLLCSLSHLGLNLGQCLPDPLQLLVFQSDLALIDLSQVFKPSTTFILLYQSGVVLTPLLLSSLQLLANLSLPAGTRLDSLLECSDLLLPFKKCDLILCLE